MNTHGVNSFREDTRSGRELLVMCAISAALALLILQALIEDASWLWHIITAHLPI